VAGPPPRPRPLLLARLHELQQRHLPGRVLQSDAVDPQPQLGLAAVPLLLGEVIGVGDQDLLGEGEGAAEAPAGLVQLAGHGFVQPLDLVNRHGGPPPMSLAERAASAPALTGPADRTHTYRLLPGERQEATS